MREHLDSRWQISISAGAASGIPAAIDTTRAAGAGSRDKSRMMRARAITRPTYHMQKRAKGYGIARTNSVNIKS